MAITAKDIQALREATGVGMMDCKKALTEAGGDMDKAILLLRERGLAAAAKKAGRIAAEGIVDAFISPKDGTAVVLEVNIETDFAAKNEGFVAFTKALSQLIAEQNPADVDALKQLPFPGAAGTVEEELQNMVLTIGENIQIRRFERIEGGAGVLNASYIHMNGKIGVVTSFEVSAGLEANDEIAQAGKDTCMQVAAMRPQYIRREDVPEAKLAEEREILMTQTLNEGKPQNVAEKIVNGRMGKFFEEFCLVDQEFIKESKQTVGAYLEATAKAQGGAMKPVKFFRFEKGEGIEKRSDNFAEEVACMTK